MLIRAEAEGTDTYELNRNLVLTDGARADSVPNLEIETGEIVGAGHASATGRFDDEQLFYLQSRGIPADEARRLVVRGFFAEVIDQIGIPELQERLLGARRGRARRRGALMADFVNGPARVADVRRRRRRCGSMLDGIPVAVVRSRGRGLRDPRRLLARQRRRCPRARSRTAPSSAGCTARASTCAPASPTGLPATKPVPVYPVKIDGDDVLVAVTPKSWRAVRWHVLEIRDLHVTVERRGRPDARSCAAST